MSNFIKEWTNKEVENLTKSFRRYSVFVFILKFVLPLTALVMIVTLFVYPMLSDSKKKILLVAHDAKEVAVTESPTMTNPKFVGVDSKNQPYEIMAKRAVQQGKGVVTMEDVTASITLIGEKWVSVVAQKGRYEMEKNFVNLVGDVNVFITDPNGDTTQITADDADIDVKAGLMKSDKPVSVQSPTLNFKAQNFVLDKENQKITFQGGVKLTIIKQ